ncbi:MAG: hypothetical protein Q8N84_00440 [bacterium]|nr:hypothetical protein [bacterium]
MGKSFLENLIGKIIDSALGGVSKRRLTSTEEEKVISDWQRIQELVTTGSPSSFKQAVINADKLLEFTLSIVIGVRGLGDCLKLAKDKFSPEVYDNLWKAHKVRNALVHDTTYDPPYFVAKEAVENFGQGFKELGIRI